MVQEVSGKQVAGGILMALGIAGGATAAALLGRINKAVVQAIGAASIYAGGIGIFLMIPSSRPDKVADTPRQNPARKNTELTPEEEAQFNVNLERLYAEASDNDSSEED